jgi:histidyl-tRNA synthetase
VEQNPLRVLDSKHEAWQDVVEHAPQITEYLSDASRDHFERVQTGLDRLGIGHELDPRLVRGFDYYTSTAFEFLPDLVDAAQTAIGGGGRYDQLAESMGGRPTPGIGFGIGIERLLIACDAEGVFADEGPRVDAFVVNGLGSGADLDVASVVASLRENGLRSERAYGDRSVKAQWKLADKSRAAFGVMLGKSEAGRGAVAVKDLRTGNQVEIARDTLVAWLQSKREEELGS